MRRLRRWWAQLQLDRIDAEVARWYVDDGQLTEQPLRGAPSDHSRRLRARRYEAVAALEAAGGRDPHPLFTLPPTEAQRAGAEARRREAAEAWSAMHREPVWKP